MIDADLKKITVFSFITEMPVVAWLAVGVSGGLASFAVIGLLACVIARQRRRRPVTSTASITTDVDDEQASVSDSDAGSSCSPAQDIVVSQSTPDLTGQQVPFGSRVRFTKIGIRCDTRCYFNMRLKADMRRLNLPHGNDN